MKPAARALFDGDNVIAALDASVVSAECFVAPLELQFSLDPISGELLEWATAISEAWEHLEPFNYGPVVILHAFWIAPERRGRLDLAALLNAFTHSLSRKHSAVMFRASALNERKHWIDPHDGREVGLERLYARRLGAELLPGDAGVESWMWLPRPDLRGVMPEPDGDGRSYRT